MTLEINKKLCRRDTFRSGGKGGQHQNVTDSGVRYTYLPLRISAESRNERSQSANDKAAWELLIKKVDEYYENLKKSFDQKQYQDKSNPSFGEQIRTYRLTGKDQNVVDHRTGIKDSNPKRVLDGNLDKFIEGNLKNEN